MDLTGFSALLTPTGQEALAAAQARAPQEKDFLQHFTALSRRYPAELARAALEVAILRLTAQAKFPFAGQMYFTRPALEQASSYPVASYRLERFNGYTCLADLGCSVGSDTLVMAGKAPVYGLDLDPLRLQMARANLEALGSGGRAAFIQADLAAPLPVRLPAAAGLFFDPARRSEGRRIYSVHDYLPPLDMIQNWLPHYPALAVKLSPGVDLAELQAYQAEIEFISAGGELKEAVLWFGPLRQARRRAVLLPGPQVLSSDQPYPAQGQPERRLPLSEPLEYLYEPDPAVLRAGLVQDLGLQLGAAQLDEDIAYLTARAYSPTPFARTWRVEDWLPFNLKRLRAVLRARGVGRVTVKKRGSPIQPESLIRDLRLSGDGERTLFLTHLRGSPIVIMSNEELAG